MNYASAGIGMQAASNVYQGQQQAGLNAPAPRTISSAIGRVEGLNERLSRVREHLTSISDQIGGPRAATDAGTKPQSLPSSNAVSRLNDSADYAHDHLTEIESLLGSIGRALG